MVKKKDKIKKKKEKEKSYFIFFIQLSNANSNKLLKVSCDKQTFDNFLGNFIDILLTCVGVQFFGILQPTLTPHASFNF